LEIHRLRQWARISFIGAALVVALWITGLLVAAWWFWVRT